MNKIIGKLYLLKKSRVYYALLGLFVSAIALTHFAVQMSFIQNENFRAAVAPPLEPAVKVQTKPVEPRKIEVVKVPEAVQPVSSRRREIAPPAPTQPNRKKIARETRAGRLRRAERILTGV